jgi:glycosyltransferase involved in cell wall biosynthesis
MAATVGAIRSARPAEVRVMAPDPQIDLDMRIRMFDLGALGADVAEFRFTGGVPTYREVNAFIDAFQPDVVVVSGWNYLGYMRMLRENRGRFVRALSMDNQWLWKLKQFGGMAISPWLVKPCFDVVFASGARQRRMARLLGFQHSQIFEGYLSCDWPLFSAHRAGFAGPPKFLYAGRLVDVKGIEALLGGYRLYRGRNADPWPLELIGVGPFEETARREPGVTVKSFMQPAELAAALAEASCFVLPNKFEPWGVVLHEAASAGLPLIASAKVGSADVVLRHGWNGLLLDRVDDVSIADSLGRIAALDPGERQVLGERSARLARDLTPDIWAETFWRACDMAKPAP